MLPNPSNDKWLIWSGAIIVLGIVLIVLGISAGNGDVTCGDRVMSPDTRCVINGDSKSYEEMRETQSINAIWQPAAGAALVIGGTVAVILRIRRRRQVFRYS